MSDILSTVVLAAMAAVYVALFVYYLGATFIGQPYWDMLSIVTRYLQYQRDGNLWSYLWEPHVQHRQIWMRLLTAFDASVFAGIAYPFLIAAAACQATSAWVLWRVSRKSVPDAHGAWLGCLAVMLVLTSVAAVDCAIPMNGIYPQALMFSVLAIVAVDGGDDTGRGKAPWRLAATVVCAMAAAFGNAAALGLWPILAWLAWQSGAGRRATMAVVAAGVVFGGFYLYRLPGAAAGDGVPMMNAAALTRAADYLLTYLGLPWTRSAALAAPGRVLGAVFLVVSLVAGFWGLTRPIRSRLDRMALALMAFSLATALLASLGRSEVDADLRVPVRYSVFVAPMHIGILFLAWPRLASRLAVLGKLRVLYSVAVVVALVLTAQQYVSGRAAIATTAAMRETLGRFAAGEQTDDMRSVVYVDLGQARRDLDAIHAAGLYLRAR